jgi:hypothetical protein
MKNIENIIRKELQKVVKESIGDTSNDGTYMVLSNLVQMKNDIEKILNFKHMPDFPKLVTGEHAWAGDHITTSKDDIEEVANFMEGYFQQKNLSESTKKSNSSQQAAIAVNMKKKGIEPKNESYGEVDESKNTPTNPKLWAASLAWARSRYDVCPSAYCNGAAAKRYKSKGGGWRKSKK